MSRAGSSARSPTRVPISDGARLAVLVVTLAGCGARTDLGGPGSDLGEGGSSTTVRDPVCAVLEVCNEIDDDCDGETDESCDDPTIDLGCADGQREGFLDVEAFPDIAACAGGFAIGGLAFGPDARCDRIAGDDGTRPNGSSCAAEDLCAPGWTVCPDEAEVARLAGTCEGAATGPGLFFTTRQSGPGCGICALGTNESQADCDCACNEGCAPRPWATNDLFGCGTVGDPTTRCGVLDRFSNDLCGQLGAPWSCGSPVDGPSSPSCRESSVASKSGPDGGGVLCCRAVRGE